MRVVITENGCETRLHQHEFKEIEKCLKFLRILARERPMVGAYAQAKEGLEEIQRLFGKQLKHLEVYQVVDEAFAEMFIDHIDPKEKQDGTTRISRYYRVSPAIQYVPSVPASEDVGGTAAASPPEGGNGSQQAV